MIWSIVNGFIFEAVGRRWPGGQALGRFGRDVCLWHLADIDPDAEHVRFWG